MQSIHADNVNWKSTKRGVREAKIFSAFHGSDETRIDLVEVPAGSYIPPHRHSFRREFITILVSAGAQMQIGDRIFRPIAGQVFHREPEDVLAVTNDSHHPFQYSVVRFGFEPTDIVWMGKSSEDNEEVVEEAAGAEEAATEETVEEKEVASAEEQSASQEDEEESQQSEDGAQDDETTSKGDADESAQDDKAKKKKSPKKKKK